MINFPVIKRLSVSGYGLYPSESPDQKLEIDVPEGPLIVLGVNGLGKSTLLLLIRYMLTGPVKARDAGFAGERSKDIQDVGKNLFSARVEDKARGAIASLVVQVGNAVITVDRALSDLSLISASVNEGSSVEPIDTEHSVNHAISKYMNLERFADSVGIFDRVCFYLEKRQPLLWDLSAQFEVFRAILTPGLSAEIRKLEGEILSADSSARNLNAALYKITSRRNNELDRIQSKDATLAKLAAAEAHRDRIANEVEQLSDQIETASQDVATCNLAYKRAEHTEDEAAQKYEKIKFEAIRQAFASVPPTEQYLLLKLISDRICLACNNKADEAAQELEDRQEHSKCLVCGNNLHQSESIVALSERKKKNALKAYEHLQACRRSTEIAKVNLDQARDHEAEFRRALLEKFDAQEAANRKVRNIRKSLPEKDNAQLSAEENRMAALRNEVQSFREERKAAEEEIDGLLASLRREVEQTRAKLEARFSQLAATFFVEEVKLVYAPRQTRIGQQGRTFSFPAFEVEMTSGAALSDFVRRNEEQVSLSQKDYLDIIFRMALIDVFSSGAGTLIIDGPEGSVDAIFAEKAGRLFSDFSASSGRSAILACNIVEGGFIPYTLKRYPGKKQKMKHIINLLNAGAPTAALKTLRPDYQKKVDEILKARANG